MLAVLGLAQAVAGSRLSLPSSRVKPLIMRSQGNVISADLALASFEGSRTSRETFWPAPLRLMLLQRGCQLSSGRFVIVVEGYSKSGSS